uniref:Uncharacterized protein n=1 Tax=Anguilla anguilla TaxID=7936 RepID=A0A0E9XCP6_ANGAN
MGALGLFLLTRFLCVSIFLAPVHPLNTLVCPWDLSNRGI